MSSRTCFSRSLRACIAGSVACLLMLVGMAAPVQAQMKPMAVISVTDYDELLTDVDFLGEFGGQVKAGQQANNMLLLFTQNKGLEGLDTKKPWGAIVQTDGFQFVPVVCLPVTDYDALLKLPTMFQMAVSDVGDGISEIEIPNQSVYVKKSGNWAYLAQDPEQLANTPADPSELFASLAKDYDIGVRFMVQNVPEMYRSIAIEQIRAGAQQGLQQMDEETDEAFEARRKMAEANVEQVVKLVNELNEFEIGINTDSEAGSVNVDINYSGVPGSEMAKQIAAFSTTGSKFAGCMKEGAAIEFNLTSETPEEIINAQREMLEGQFEAMRQQAMNAIDQEADEDQKSTIKDAVNDLMDSFVATMMTGKFDIAGHIDLSDGMSMIAGGFAKDTDKLESAMKKGATLAEDDPKFPGVNWNAGNHAGFTLHTMSVPVPEEELEAREMFGETLEIVLALGEDAFFMAAGKNSMSNLKSAIDGSNGSTVAVKPFHFSMAMIPLIEFGNKMEPNPAAGIMVDAINNKGGGKDKMHMTGELVGDKVRFRIALEKGVLHAIGATAMELSRNQGPPPGF